MKTSLQQLFQPGDIILVHGNSFLSKGIQFFMKIYAKKEHRSDKVFFNHAAIIIDVWGDVFVCEADRTKKKGIQAGVIINRIEDTSYFQGKNFIILKPIIKYSLEEKQSISNAAVNFAFKNIRYDYIGTFFNQIGKVITGKWKGKTGEKSEQRVYCSELVAVITNKVRENTFADSEATNPQDIFWNDNFTHVDQFNLLK